MAGKVVSKLQLTLALIKPDMTGNPLLIEEIQRLWTNHEFTIVCSKTTYLSRLQVENFYMEHKRELRIDMPTLIESQRACYDDIHRFSYQNLYYVNTRISGPIVASILYREDAIAYWRKLMGGTKVYRTIYEAPDTIRGSWGLTDTRNSLHGSDSPKSAVNEISTFFPEFSIIQWYGSLESNTQAGMRDFVEQT